MNAAVVVSAAAAEPLSVETLERISGPYAIAYEPISLYVARMSMTDAVPTQTLDETLAELVGVRSAGRLGGADRICH